MFREVNRMLIGSARKLAAGLCLSGVAFLAAPLMLIVGGLSLAVPQAVAQEVEGVDVPESLTFGDHTLTLNGAGMRTKFFVDAYIAALYLSEVSSEADAIIQADAPTNIRVFITSDLITGKRFSEAVMDGFVRATHGNLGPIRVQIDTMIATFRADMKQGDVFDLHYLPGRGTEIYRNGDLQTVAPGLDFKQAMMAIWLSEDAVQGSLRERMLAQ